jgi:hypothetical protein
MKTLAGMEHDDGDGSLGETGFYTPGLHESRFTSKMKTPRLKFRFTS